MIDQKVEASQTLMTRLVAAVRALGLGGLVAAILENAGPLPLLGAQALYFAAPVVDTFGAGDDILSLAHLLEDPTQTQELAQQLVAK